MASVLGKRSEIVKENKTFPPLKKQKIENKELPYHQKSLLELCNNGEWTYIENAIFLNPDNTSNWDLNEKDEEGNTPLLICCRKGALSTLQAFYFYYGVFDVHDCDYKGNTMILHACKSGNIEIVDWLLKHGSSLDDKNLDDETCIRISFTNAKNFILGKWLLNTQNISNTLERQVRYVFCWAVKHGKIELVQYLLNRNPNYITIKQKDFSCIFFAGLSQQWEMVKWLILYRKSFVADYTDTGETIFLLAAYHGNVPLLKWLLEHGSSIWENNSQKQNCLLLSAWGGHLDAVKWLVQYNKSLIGEKCISGNTALLYAAQGGHTEIVKWLLHHGGRLDQKNKKKYTCLLLAAKKGNIDLVKWLLTHGSYINESDNRGNTSLLLASSKGYFELVKWLLCHGSLISEKNYRDDSAIILAAKGGHNEIVKFLHKKGCPLSEPNVNSTTCLLIASHNGNFELVKYLLENGSKITEVDGNGNSCLLAAVISGNIDLIKYLISKGCSISKRSNSMNTCITLASAYGYLDLVQFFIEKGCSLYDMNTTGTCVSIAAANKRTGMVIWMLNNGSSIEENIAYNYSGDIVTVKSCEEVLKYYNIYEDIKKAMTTKSSRK